MRQGQARNLRRGVPGFGRLDQECCWRSEDDGGDDRYDLQGREEGVYILLDDSIPRLE